MGAPAHILGTLGIASLAVCWVPQSVETIRAGRCGANRVFLLLSAFGSCCLGAYALILGDPVFVILNALTTLGAAVNLFYRYFPRVS